MVKVFYWKRNLLKLEAGHISVQAVKTYISWWPGPLEKRVADKVNKIAIKLLVDDSTPFYTPQSIHEDIELKERNPDRIFTITGLNEHALLSTWESIKQGLNPQTSLGDYPRKSAEYHIRAMNCSHIVYWCLKNSGFGELLSERLSIWSQLDFEMGGPLLDVMSSISAMTMQPHLLVGYLEKVADE